MDSERDSESRLNRKTHERVIDAFIHLAVATDEIFRNVIAHGIEPNKPCEYCGSLAVERDDNGTLLGCIDCGYETQDVFLPVPDFDSPIDFGVYGTW